MSRILVVGAEANPVTGRAEVTHIPTKVLIGMVAEAGDDQHKKKDRTQEVQDEYCDVIDGVADVTPIAEARAFDP